MRRSSVLTGAAVLILGTAVASTTAAAQDVPVCGPPGEEQPATIVGEGTIVGTAG